VQDAMAHGAHALNHTRVTDLIRDGGKVIGVRYRGPDGATSEARARVVVNATGPWSPEIGTMAGVKVDLRPAKGIHIVYPHRISNFSISAESIDGRDLLMVAHAGFTLRGTTDDDFYGDLDSVDVQEDEVEYLLQGFERVFPAIRDYRPVRTTTGVRPTLFKWRRYEDELSRRYEVIDHSASGAEGFITIAGGKLSMYRLMAEETSDAVHAARHEQVGARADACRGVGVAAGPCAGAACILRAAEVVGRELGWSATQRFDAAREFVRGAWLGRAPVLPHAGWAQEEL